MTDIDESIQRYSIQFKLAPRPPVVPLNAAFNQQKHLKHVV